MDEMIGTRYELKGHMPPNAVIKLTMGMKIRSLANEHKKRLGISRKRARHRNYAIV